MNAVQAAPEGGVVRVQAEADSLRVRVRVRDSGPGVPRALRSRIFDPFFTTRDGGSGLGLSIAHQLAQAAGGRIDCLDPPRGSRGACFLLTLPKAAPAPPAPRAALAEALTRSEWI
jgi:signal transduction histidine kinase